MPEKLTRPAPLYLPVTPSLAYLAVRYAHFKVRPYRGWPDLFAGLPKVTPDSIVVVDPYESSPDVPAPQLFDLLERFPSISVVVALELTPDRVGDVRRMIGGGVSGVLNMRLDHDSSVAVRQFYDALGRPLKRRMQSALSPHPSADARVIVRAACEVAVLGGGAQALADVFEVSQKTLAVWCRKHRLPTTRSLQLWMRLLLAAHLLGDAGRTVQAAARAAGYSSDRALRRAWAQLLGSGPSTLNRSGAFERVAQAFNEQLHAERLALRAA